MHGDRDSLVPAAQSQELYKDLKAVGVDATLKIVAGAGHGGMAFLSPDNVLLIGTFWQRTLKQTPTAAGRAHGPGRS
jgi:acetyl esterase/lipase